MVQPNPWSTPARRTRERVSPIFLAIVAVFVVSGWALWQGFGSNPQFVIFVFVLFGWLMSLCVHEYAHARTALASGDISIGAKGYLTLNPLKYTQPLLSIVLPVVFVILGGIGLPGGAVYVERHRIPGRLRHSLISAAGPAVNLLFALGLCLPFAAGAFTSPAPNGMTFLYHPSLAYAIGFLGLLQVTATLLNLLPVPGLDGYGIVEPWLSPKIRREAERWGGLGILLVFALLWIPSLNTAFFWVVDHILTLLGVPNGLAEEGGVLFRFWGNSFHLGGN